MSRCVDGHKHHCFWQQGSISQCVRCGVDWADRDISVALARLVAAPPQDPNTCQHQMLVKAGYTKAGTQRHRCQDCGAKQVIAADHRGHFLPEPSVAQLHACFERGLSLRATETETGISKGTVGKYRLMWNHGIRDAESIRAHVDDILDVPPTLPIVPLDRLKSIVLQPKRDEDFYPLLLFKGGQTLGRTQALWNFVLAAQAAELPTISRMTWWSHYSRDAIHLLGLHSPVQHLTMRGFLSRLWYSPEVMALDPHMRDYLALIAKGDPDRYYWQFTRVDRWAKWKTKREWRKPPRKARVAKPPKVVQPKIDIPQFWPFVSGVTTNDHDLLLAIDRCVPKELPEQVRQDVCQDLIIAVLSGEVSIDALHGSVAKHVGDVFKMHPMKYGPLSLDAPAPWAADDDRPLSSFLATE